MTLDKQYVFLMSSPCDRSSFVSALVEAGAKKATFVFVSDSFGRFYADSKLAPVFDDLLPILHEDLGTNIGLLASHGYGPFEESIIQKALQFFPNSVCFPSDVIMKQMSFGDMSFYGNLTRLFKKVPRELLLTAKAYLTCGLDASLAAEKLLIHRNTFNYRLNAFIEKTDLDIRDYHNALLLELYIDLSSGHNH